MPLNIKRKTESQPNPDSSKSAILDQVDFVAFWEEYKTQADPGRLRSAIDREINFCKSLADKAREAEAAYFDDVKRKQAAVNTSVETLESQLSNIQTKLSELTQPLIEATTNGETEKLTSIRAEIKGIELERAQIQSELEMLKSTTVKGCEKLFNTTFELNDEFEAAKGTLSIHACKVLDANLVNSLKSIEHMCDLLKVVSHMGHTAGRGADIEKLDKYHNAEKYKAKAAAEHAAHLARLEDQERRNRSLSSSRPASAYDRPAPGFDYDVVFSTGTRGDE
ncbi:MAG: hypothetical protein FWC13_07590 [Oscillospiraceae bacterium]|nr:hypothetical protein [Oscillospiraceae bacterium]